MWLRQQRSYGLFWFTAVAVVGPLLAVSAFANGSRTAIILASGTLLFVVLNTSADSNK